MATVFSADANCAGWTEVEVAVELTTALTVLNALCRAASCCCRFAVTSVFSSVPRDSTASDMLDGFIRMAATLDRLTALGAPTSSKKQ